MEPVTNKVVRAECDAADRLLRADEPLVALQLACGGRLPGTIAVPELLALVRSARRLGGELADRIHAQDGGCAVSAWAVVKPTEGGSLLSLSEWRTSPLPEVRELPADRALTDFIAAAEHGGSDVFGGTLRDRLRPPVQRIIADAEAIQLQRSGPLADRYAAYAGDIAAAARHLLELVEDFFGGDASEAETPTLAELVDLAELAREAVAIIGQRAGERLMILEGPGDEVCWPAVGDRRCVMQILLNLIGNALSYAPPGSIVRVGGEERDGRALLTVSDEGPGLEPAEQARVFDKFERLGRSGDGGSGLGLHISRQLARAMAGDLTIASRAGEGTRFTLDLPGR